MRDSLVLLLVLTICKNTQCKSDAKARYEWGEWATVTNCPRKCSEDHANIPQSRHCMACIPHAPSPKCVIARDVTQCKVGSTQTIKPCYIGTECDGAGSYTGDWGPWEPLGKCPPSGERCANRRMTYTRRCLKGLKSEGEFSCGTSDTTKDRKSTDCPCVDRPSPAIIRLQAAITGQWTHWGDWYCIKDCVPGVFAFRNRICVGSGKELQCQSDENGIEGVQKTLCRQGTSQRCRKTWGEWGSWSKCTNTCGSATKTMQRKCGGFGAPCWGKAVKVEECPTYLPCEVIDGKWGSWGAWELDCSVTCGFGLRSRVRECNNPKPSGNGRDCEGDKIERLKCFVKVKCPTHGGFSAWDGWNCAATCGGGNGERRRTCNNPEPMNGGDPCQGESKEYTNTCSNKTCPSSGINQEFPKDLESILISYLNRSYNNYEMTETATLVLSCEIDIVRSFLKRFPNLRMTWIKNGITLEYDAERIRNDGHTLVFNHLHGNDSGVYMCQLENQNGLKRVMDVHVVTVRTLSPSIVAYVGGHMDLPCNGESLTSQYPYLRQRWYHNGTVFKDYGLISLKQSSNIHRVDNLTERDSGTWLCTMTDAKTKRKWITDFERVQIDTKPFWKETKFIVGIVLAIVLVLVITACIIYTKERQKQEDKKKMVLALRQELMCDRPLSACSRQSEDDEFSCLGLQRKRSCEAMKQINQHYGPKCSPGEQGYEETTRESNCWNSSEQMDEKFTDEYGYEIRNEDEDMVPFVPNYKSKRIQSQSMSDAEYQEQNMCIGAPPAGLRSKDSGMYGKQRVSQNATHKTRTRGDSRGEPSSGSQTDFERERTTSFDPLLEELRSHSSGSSVAAARYYFDSLPKRNKHLQRLEPIASITNRSIKK